jgi:hypothetical protein
MLVILQIQHLLALPDAIKKDASAVLGIQMQRSQLGRRPAAFGQQADKNTLAF